MKNAYLIIPDLHYASAKEHRLNYFGEVISIVQQLLSLCEEYRAQDYKVILLFLGDIVDGSISQAEDAMRCQDLFAYIKTQVDGIYTVLGNHEENNVSDNPFWFLVSELGDASLNTLRRAIQPKGVSDIIRVPDIILDGDITFYFNHYGVPAKTPSGDGIAIGLFHQNVGSNDICKMWGTFDDVEQAAYVQPYNYCFFGHMHLALGKYWLNETHTCQGEWLGTCIGTNVNEVIALPRELAIPVVVVQEGKFQGIQRKTLLRSDPDMVIDKTKLEITQASKELLKQRQESLPIAQDIDTLYNSVFSVAEQVGMGFLIELLQKSYDIVRYEYRQGLSNTLTFDGGEESDGSEY